MLNFVPPDEAIFVLNLAQSKYRPPEILELKERIRRAKISLAQGLDRTGRIDPVGFNKVLKMMFDLDRLYELWGRSMYQRFGSAHMIG